MTTTDPVAVYASRSNRRSIGWLRSAVAQGPTGRPRQRTADPSPRYPLNGGRLLVTTKSTRLRQFEHRQRSSISGTSPRPPATNAARSACWLRRPLRQDTSTAT
jgi:hypothetical protein